MSRSRLAFLLAGLAVQPFTLPVDGLAVPQDGVPKYEQVSYRQLRLVLKRSPQAIELVVQGAGPRAQVAGRLVGSRWEGLLTPSQPSLLPEGDQVFDRPGGGLDRVELKADGSQFKLAVQGQSGSRLASPTVSSDGPDLILRFPAIEQPQEVKAQYDLNQPGRLPQSRFAPPLRSRAVAPPVGDMAIGSMLLKPRGFLEVSGPPVTLTTKGADARDLLMALARLGGYSFAFSEDSSSGGEDQKSSALPVTVAFQNEPFTKAFNFILMASGLQGRLEGGVILAGKNVLAKTIGNQMSKVFRLNQVDPNSAADYLANLGATISKTNTITTTSNEGSSTGTGGGAAVGGSTTSQSTSEQSTRTVIEAYGATSGPLLGLQGVTDSRLGTITLVGEPQIIAIAEGYLRQLDLRKRQVSINVKMINIDLSNNMDVFNSFAYQTSNTFVVSDNGKGAAYFGFRGDRAGEYENAPGATQGDLLRRVTDGGNLINPTSGRPIVRGDTTAPAGSLVDPLPLFVPNVMQNQQFIDRLEATITSLSGKQLANPTLIVQEGSSAKVEAVRSVITNVSEQVTTGGNVTCSFSREDAGLILDLKVDKIDDNGFVTLNMKPETSIPQSAGTAQCSGSTTIYNIVKRTLESGSLRLRDGQTLVVTGVIQEDQVASANKIPILGDIPIIGQFFRGSSNLRQRSELIVLVTPRIVRDDNGGSYGYGTISQSAP